LNNNYIIEEKRGENCMANYLVPILYIATAKQSDLRRNKLRHDVHVNSMENREQKLWFRSVWTMKVEAEETIGEGKKYYYHEAVAIIRGTSHDTNYFGQRRCTYAIIIIKNKPFGHKKPADCRPTVVVVVATYIVSIIILSSVFVRLCV